MPHVYSRIPGDASNSFAAAGIYGPRAICFNACMGVLVKDVTIHTSTGGEPLRSNETVHDRKRGPEEGA
ncbi:MAG: hypothetical protein WC003_07700 [Terrimicrobiaceae bacterium]